VLPPLVGLMVNRIPWPALADLALLALQLSFPVCLLLLVGVAHELCAKLVARAGAPSVAALGAALQGAGPLAAVQGDGVGALASCEEALTLFRLLGRVPEIAATLSHLASIAARQGRDWWEQHLNEAALLIWVRRQERGGIAAALRRLGAAALRRGQL